MKRETYNDAANSPNGKELIIWIVNELARCTTEFLKRSDLALERTALRTWEKGDGLTEQHKFALANSAAYLRSQQGDDCPLAEALELLLSSRPLSEEATCLLKARLVALDQ